MYSYKQELNLRVVFSILIVAINCPDITAMLAISINDTKKWLDHIFANTSLGQRMLYRLNLNSLRYTYYLITPSETMFETVDEVPNYTVQFILPKMQ
ncbi:hypothetical protein X798_07972 [Onchocerca flexuosa]|uniref:Uncharacterized protein n=1 Tax=Onchocerca flexuosa TaxID=387005 RepID=A0A238BKD8_9BILA|nr:hypothetical protein X798_07972 [Onchocerca flexuosa]